MQIHLTQCPYINGIHKTMGMFPFVDSLNYPFGVKSFYFCCTNKDNKHRHDKE